MQFDFKFLGASELNYIFLLTSVWGALCCGALYLHLNEGMCALGAVPGARDGAVKSTAAGL